MNIELIKKYLPLSKNWSKTETTNLFILKKKQY